MEAGKTRVRLGLSDPWAQATLGRIRPGCRLESNALDGDLGSPRHIWKSHHDLRMLSRSAREDAWDPISRLESPLRSSPFLLTVTVITGDDVMNKLIEPDGGRRVNYPLPAFSRIFSASALLLIIVVFASQFRFTASHLLTSFEADIC